jgi:type II secretory pathway predicted ATPase ExeA
MTSHVESHFGLKQLPFSVSGSSGPVFMTESLREAAVFLRKGLADGASILGVTGAAGIGKSSLTRALPKLTKGKWRIATMSGHAGSWEELGEILTREFEIGRDRITRDSLAEARKKFGKLLIVVDDAQYLTPNLLERICVMPQLRTDADEPAVQVILLADLDALSREDIRPLLAWLDVEARHVMQPTPAEDVHRYIDTRMRRVGWRGEPLICESGASALYRLSRGNPRRLSAACIEAIDHAAARGIARIDGEFVVGCSTAEIGDAEEPLTAPAGADLSDDTMADPKNTQTACDRQDRQLRRAPLTAENIATAPSLELANIAKELDEFHRFAAPIESMRSTSRPMMRTRPDHLRPSLKSGASRNRSHGKRRSLLLAGFCTLATVAAVYTARTEVAGMLREFGMGLMTVADVVESTKIESEARTRVSAIEVDRPIALQLIPGS